MVIFMTYKNDEIKINNKIWNSEFFFWIWESNIWMGVPFEDVSLSVK